LAKRLLEKNFKKDVDYVVENISPLLGGKLSVGRQNGGHNNNPYV